MEKGGRRRLADLYRFECVNSSPDLPSIMSRRKICLLAALLVFILALILLFTGSPLLELEILGDPYLPAGTLITWFGMIALPAAIYWGIKEMRQPGSQITRFLSGLLKVLLILAILWAPICSLLAGNLAFNFSEVQGFQGGQTAMRMFWWYSYGLPVESLLLLLIYWSTSLTNRMGRIS